MSQLTYCNEGCNNRFHIDELHVDKLPNSIQKTYINCPYCGKEYLVYYTDKSIRQLQYQMRQLHKQMGIEGADLLKLFNKEAILKKKIKDKMENIKNKFSLEEKRNE